MDCRHFKLQVLEVKIQLLHRIIFFLIFFKALIEVYDRIKVYTCIESGI
jgi:hypothetical protein